MKGRLARMAHAVLRPLGIKSLPVPSSPAENPGSPPTLPPAQQPSTLPPVRDTTPVKPWDRQFADWIAEAGRSGKDPNDVGDADWNDDPLNEALYFHYLPHVRSDAVVLELGPGTGRYTRHLMPRCREMILVDYSPFVCEWLGKYFAGKGRFRVVLIDKPLLEPVESASVDTIVASGVFEHIDPDETFSFLKEFRRVLRQGGAVALNFDNFMSETGAAWFLQWQRPAGERSPFRFYHPEFFAQLARMAGFEVLKVSTSRDRIAFIELRKRASGDPGAL